MLFTTIPAVALSLFLVQTPAPQGAGTLDALQGTWIPSSAELAGKPLPDEMLKLTKLVIKGNTYVLTLGDQTDQGTLKLNTAVKPKTVDIISGEGVNKGKTFLAIYEQVDADTARLCYDFTAGARPKEFKTDETGMMFLVTYKRQK